MDFAARSRESSAPRRESSVLRRQRANGPGRCAMKLLTPQELAAAVMGFGGASIREMERSTQAVIEISQRHELFPKSECRILTATADNEKSLNMVARQVLDKLIEANHSHADSGTDEGQLKISVLVPRAVVMGLVSSGGKGVRQLCENSSAIIKIKDPVSGTGPDASQELQLRGRSQALGTALQELNREVQMVNSEPWFSAWATPSLGVPNTTKEPGDGVAAAQGESRQLSPEQGLSSRVLSAMKVLVPPVLAAALTGPLFTEIEKKAQAKVHLSAPEEYFPCTECRVLTARADTEESLNLVGQWIVERLVEVAETDPSDAVIGEGCLRLNMLLPKAAATALIGRGGSAIKQLCDESSAEIRVHKEIYEATQNAFVEGTAKGLEQVIRNVNTHVHALRDESWFHKWASAATFSTTWQNGGGPPRGLLSPMAEAGLDLVGSTIKGLPDYVLEESRGFALTCVVPARLRASVVGCGGKGLAEVQRATGTTIAMRPGDADNFTMNIAGPLPNTCSAYMLMMKRYLDAEREVMKRSDAM